MRLHEVVQLLARRLALRPGRVQTIAGRLQEAGLLSKTEGSRRFPPDVAEPEAVTLIIAALAEDGIGTAPQAVATFSALTDPEGRRLDHVVSSILYGPPRDVRHLVVRQAPPGASLVIDGTHKVFGADPPEGATKARAVSGHALTAIGAELRGASAAEADAVAAITKIRGLF